MKWMTRLIPVVGATTLLATAAVGAAAQEDAAAITTPLYITWTSGEPTSTTEGSFDEEAGEMRGFRMDGIPLEVSDPRLSGIASVVINGNFDEGLDHAAYLESRSYRIDNDEGAWTGSATYVELGDTSGDEWVPLIVQEMSLMVGEGAYEGLIMVGIADYLESDSAGEAVIYTVSTPPVAEIPDVAAK